MKQIVCFLLLLTACQNREDFIRIKGSDSVLPLTQKEIEIFSERQPKPVISLTGGGSGVGIAGLIDGTADIAMSSRALKISEKLRLQEKKHQATELIVAYDALAVVVHPENPVSKLTREEIEGIFTGKIKNWQQVGGENSKIVAYSRESSSGTHEFFKSKVLDNKEFSGSVLSLASNGAIIQSISQTKGAIGYIGLAYLNPEIKALAVSFDKSKTFVKPDFETAKQKTYPIIRPLYYYFLQNKILKIKPFTDFALSDEGQKTVKNIGYIPVK